MNNHSKLYSVAQWARRSLTLVGGAMLLLALASCSDSSTDDEEYPSDWKDTNAEYFNRTFNNARQAIAAGSTSWKVIRNFSLNAPEFIPDDRQSEYIVVEELVKGEGPGCPLFSDTVVIHYQGRLLPSKSYPEGKVFDGTWTTGELNMATAAPRKMGVYYTQTYNSSTSSYSTSACIDGFSTALQNMHVGDRWRVYIPQELAYKGEDNSDIPAYSTLIFDITLVAYYKPGQAVPDWKSNALPWWDEEK